MSSNPRTSVHSRDAAVLKSTDGALASERRRALARGMAARLEGSAGVVLLPPLRPQHRTRQPYYEQLFRQDSWILYFSGLGMPGAGLIIDLDEDRFEIFVPEMTPDELVWHDAEPTRAEIATATGADRVDAPEALSGRVAELIAAGRAVHVLRDTDWPELSASAALVDAAVELRLTKSEDEVARMREVMAVTERAHHLAMGVTRPGSTEAEVQAAVELVFRAAGMSPAYGPIATCRGEVLHAKRPHRPLTDGGLFLLDAGAEAESGYTTDVTRAWPINGRFSEIQADIYDIVLAANQAGIAACNPGESYVAVHEAASRVVIRGLKELGLIRAGVSDDEVWEADAHALFFPHGVGHLIGLDVHDLEELGEDRFAYEPGTTREADKLGRRYLRLNRIMREGMVVTVEPGIYFIDGYLNNAELTERFKAHVDFDKARSLIGFGGVRIEDDVVVRAGKTEVLSAAIVKDRAAIEAKVGIRAEGLAALLS